VSPFAPGQSSRPLCDRIVTLAGKADDAAEIGADLVGIAVLSADRVAGVSYASVTSRYEGAYATVAASSDLAVEVDNAQYADGVGPCLDALQGQRPVPVPDIAATMTWPNFRDVAFGLGLRSSLSIPLFAGRGTPVAALNLYAHDTDAMKPLTLAVWSVYEADTPSDQHGDGLDAGGNELVTGLAGAFAARACIQRAMGMLMARSGGSPDEAFLALRLRAAETGATLTQTADRILADRRW
jgi:ANTAR domain/GAF domain